MTRADKTRHQSSDLLPAAEPPGTTNRNREVVQLWDDHRGKLLGYVMYLGADRDLADEIVCDSFKIIYGMWFTVKRPTEYLYGTATKLWYRALRRRMNRPTEEPLRTEEIRTPGGSEWDDPTGDQACRKVDLGRIALRKLSGRQKVVVLLGLYGFSNAEIAELLRITEKTVRNHRNEAWPKLRSHLPGYGTPDGGKSA